MFDDFLFRALLAGIGIALVTGPLGCFVVWRRMSFFGDTLSHSALLGVLLSVAFNLNISLTIFAVSSLIALILLRLQKTTNLPNDALLGLLSHSALAVGMVVLGFLSFNNNCFQSRNLKLMRISLYGNAAVGRAIPLSRVKKNGSGKDKRGLCKYAVSASTPPQGKICWPLSARTPTFISYDCAACTPCAGILLYSALPIIALYKGCLSDGYAN